MTNASNGAVLDVLPLRSPTLPPATHTNTYLLGRRSVTLVDPATPWDDERARLEAALTARDLQVERVFLTHHHPDHVGAAAWVRERYQVPVVAHARTRELLEGEVVVDELMDEGDVLVTDAGEWTALHTPGHATGHLCLHDTVSDAVIAGDMVAGVGTIVLAPPEGNLEHYLTHLDRLRALKPSVLWPAHGDAIRDAVGLLTEYIDHRHMRTRQVRAALRQVQQGGPDDLVPIIYPDLHPMIRPVAAQQVLCHLQWLAERGEVCKVGESWTPTGA